MRRVTVEPGLERLLERVEILGIEDGGERCAVDGAVFFHGIFAHIAGVGHLLGEHDDVKTHISLGFNRFIPVRNVLKKLRQIYKISVKFRKLAV